MSHFARVLTVAFSASAVGLVIVGCQPQGTLDAEVEPPVDDTTVIAQSSSDEGSSQLMSAAEISNLFAGSTARGAYKEFGWVQYFSPDGTMQSMDGAGEFSGTYYSNDQGEFCIDMPEYPMESTVFCFKLIPLGDGKYQQVLIDGTQMGVYTEIVEGNQL